MKKKILLLVLLILWCAGCSAQRNISKGAWVKEGTGPEELRKDYEECYFRVSAKNGATLEEYQKDQNYCETEAERREHKRDIMGSVASATTPIPFVGLGFDIAHLSLSNYYRRCMEAKGYLSVIPSQCMEEKGYRWK